MIRAGVLGLLLGACTGSAAPSASVAPAPAPSAPSGPRTLGGAVGPAPLAKPLPPPPPSLGPAELGRAPRPFGALAGLRRGMGRADVRRLAPGATVSRDGLAVDLGVGGLRGEVRFTASDHLDWLQLDAWPGVEAQFEAAWGRPAGPADAPYWLSPIVDGTGWRADVGPLVGGPRAAVVSIGPYVELASLLADDGDGLARPRRVHGARIVDLRREVPDLLEIVPARTSDPDPARHVPAQIRLQLPATEVCRYFTTVELSVDDDGRVDDAALRICYADDAARDGALRVMRAVWGPGHLLDEADPLGGVFFNLPHGWLVATARPDEGEGDDAPPAGRGAWIVRLSGR